MRGVMMVWFEESPQCARRCIPLPHWHADSPKGVQGGERKATLHCIAKRQLYRKKFPFGGA